MKRALLLLLLLAAPVYAQRPVPGPDVPLPLQATLSDWIIGFNIENVFTEDEAVIVESKIGDIITYQGTFFVSRLQHVTSNECPALQFPMIVSQWAFTYGGGVQVRFVGKDRTVESTGIQVLKFSGLAAFPATGNP